MNAKFKNDFLSLWTQIFLQSYSHNLHQFAKDVDQPEIFEFFDEIFTVIPHFENYKTQNDIKIDVRIRAYSWIKMHKIELFWKKHSFDDDLKCICTFIWRIYKCSLQLWTWALSKFEFQMFVGFKTGTYSFIKLFILEYHNSEAVLQCLCNLNGDGLNWT